MLKQRNLGQDAAGNSEKMPLSGLHSVGSVPPTDNPGGYGDGDPGDEACNLVFVNLAAYQDQELDPDQLAVVEAHLNRCPRCMARLTTLQELDAQIEREWRESAPLPSSSQFKNSIDAIMAALPEEPVAAPEYTQKRVHARARWMRFSTGMAGVVAFVSMLWSSYCLGYAHGRSNPSVRPALPSVTPTSPIAHDAALILSFQKISLPYPSSAPNALLEANLATPPKERTPHSEGLFPSRDSRVSPNRLRDTEASGLRRSGMRLQ